MRHRPYWALLSTGLALFAGSVAHAQNRDAEGTLRQIMHDHLTDDQFSKLDIGQRIFPHEHESVAIAWAYYGEEASSYVVSVRNDMTEPMCLAYTGDFENDREGDVKLQYDLSESEDGQKGFKVTPGHWLTISMGTIAAPSGQDAGPRYRFDYWTPASRSDDCETVPKIVQNHLSDFNPTFAGANTKYFGVLDADDEGKN